jgi:C4-dicarboxylate-binding protein DctP
MRLFHVLSFALLLCALDAAAADPIVIKFSHVVAADTPKGQAADKFKELAEKYTDGRVKVEVYANSTLYKDKEELEALQLGSVQMLAPSLSKFGPIGAREFEVFDLPFLFPDLASVNRVTSGPVGTRLFAKLESKGIHGLAFWDNGFKQMTANKPLRKPEDYRGLKFRIQSSKLLDAEFRVLGALPQVMAFSEVYHALQTGVVDGQENTESNIYTQKMHEVQKFLTLTNHGYIGYAVIVNKKFWDDLPADIRAKLERAMQESTRYANDVAARDNAEALAKIRATGKTTVFVQTPEERKALADAMAPVYAQFEPIIGAELVSQVRREVAGRAK